MINTHTNVARGCYIEQHRYRTFPSLKKFYWKALTKHIVFFFLLCLMWWEQSYRDDTPAGSLRVSHVVEWIFHIIIKSEIIQLMRLFNLFSSCQIKLNLRRLLAPFCNPLNLTDWTIFFFLRLFFLACFPPCNVNLCVDSREIIMTNMQGMNIDSPITLVCFLMLC